MPIRSEAPYNDDYDPSKNFTRILAVSGRNLQARELTQIGTMQRDFTERLGKAVFSQGEVLSGCDFAITDNVVTILEGDVFYDGLVRHVPKTQITITKVGIEKIGLTMETSIVSASNDSSLRDPAIGSENEGKEGCDRECEIIIWVLNNDKATTVFTLEDGVLAIKVTENSVEASLSRKMAERTFDDGGNYKVSGLNLVDAEELTEDGKIKVKISAGKAYVKGWCVENPAFTNIGIKQSTETRHVVSEPKTYSSSIARYQLNCLPVCKVEHVLADVEVTETVTRGSVVNGVDTLVMRGMDSLKEIKSVSCGDITYTVNRDFKVSGDDISWDCSTVYGHIEPNVGSSYKVTYIYLRSMQNTDFACVGNGEITFTNVNCKPINGSTFYVEYDFYLYRYDTVCLSVDGSIQILNGQSDTKSNVIPVKNRSDEFLELGAVLVYPNCNTIEIENNLAVRLTQGDIFSMYQRVSDMEYNIAMTDLDNTAKDSVAVTDLKGVFTDNFTDFSRGDITHPEFFCGLDVNMKEITLPEVMSNDDIYGKSLELNESSAELKVGCLGNVISAPYTERECLSQLLATGTFKVNEYAMFQPLTVMELSPSSDYWVDRTTMTIDRNRTIRAQVVNGKRNVSTQTEVIDQKTQTEVIKYMRPIRLTVTAYNFRPNLDVECFFDEKKISDFIPTDGCLRGSKSGTVKSSTGVIKGYFTVPSNTPCGSVFVELKQNVTDGIDRFTINCKEVFSAQGTHETDIQTVLKTTTITVPVDPIAQSFIFERDTVLMSLDLFFAKKGTSDVVVQIRGMENGYPNTTVYAQKVLTSNDVVIDGVTHVALNQPVYCEANKFYCFSILSDSNLYEVYTASLGGNSLNNKYEVTEDRLWKNPYAQGVLFTSSNASTWTAHQESDMKFVLYEAIYNKGNGVVVFNDTPIAFIDRIMILANTDDYKNAGIKWSYRIKVDGKYLDWRPIETFNITELLDISGRTIETLAVATKCELVVKDSKSPFIAKNEMNIIGLLYESTGTYVSRQATMTGSQGFTGVEVHYEAKLGNKVRAFIMTESNNEWQQVSMSEVVKIDNEFSKYKGTISLPKACFNYRIKLVFSTENVFNRPRIRKLISIMKY